MAITGQCQEIVHHAGDPWSRNDPPCKFKAKFVTEEKTSSGIERKKVCTIHYKAWQYRQKPVRSVHVPCTRCGGTGKMLVLTR